MFLSVYSNTSLIYAAIFHKKLLFFYLIEKNSRNKVLCHFYLLMLLFICPIMNVIILAISKHLIYVTAVIKK